jgi:hypothetical protein
MAIAREEAIFINFYLLARFLLAFNFKFLMLSPIFLRLHLSYLLPEVDLSVKRSGFIGMPVGMLLNWRQ